MISAQTSARQYQQAQFQTVDRGQLLLMMFDGGERFLSQAEQRLSGGDVPGFLQALGRGQAIIAELLSTLDHQRGGEIARNLDRLYRFMLDHLLEANVAKLFGGVTGGAGVADRISDYLTAVTQTGGVIDVHNTAVGKEISSLEERIAAGQRNLDAFEENLRAQFTSLEVLVQSLKSQGSFLLSALGSNR